MWYHVAENFKEHILWLYYFCPKVLSFCTQHKRLFLEAVYHNWIRRKHPIVKEFLPTDSEVHFERNKKNCISSGSNLIRIDRRINSQLSAAAGLRESIRPPFFFTRKNLYICLTGKSEKLCFLCPTSNVNAGKVALLRNQEG